MRKRIVIIIAVFMVVIASTLLFPCCKHGGSTGIFATPIEEIVASPQHFENRTVTIAGKVTRSVGLGKRSAYLVNDGTGSIWVLDHSRAPAIGEEVRIRGQPQQLFRIGEKSVTVFKTVEQQ